MTGSWVVRGSLQLWDMTSGKIIETIEPENRPTSLDGEFLYAVQYFDGDPYGDHVLAAGSGTGNVEVINIKNKKALKQIIFYLTRIFFSFFFFKRQKKIKK